MVVVDKLVVSGSSEVVSIRRAPTARAVSLGAHGVSAEVFFATVRASSDEHFARVARKYHFFQEGSRSEPKARKEI